MLVSGLLTLTTAWLAGASPSQLQIPLRQQELASPQQHPAPSPPTSPSSKNGAVSAALFAELEELSRIVDISYCVGAVGVGVQKPFVCPSRCADFPTFELVTTWNTGPMLSDSCGYVALSHAPAPKRVIVAFRGTYSLANTIADLSTTRQEYVPYPGHDEDDNRASRRHRDQQHHDDSPPPTTTPRCLNCTVHTGFYTSWLNTREVILPHVLAALDQHPDYTLTLVGHSLGGAVAALAGLELVALGLRPVITTFGEPRLGNAALAEFLDLRFQEPAAHHPAGQAGPEPERPAPSYRRVTHTGDPIPLLPLDEWGYAPHAGEIFIVKDGLPPNVTDLRLCDGPKDRTCIAAPDNGGFWAIPSRFRLWQLFFAHRDYFWRLGLCVPTMDGWWPQRVDEGMDL